MDPDTWAVISAVTAMMALSHVLMMRTLKSETETLRAQTETLRAQTESLQAQTEAGFAAAREHADGRFDAAIARADAQFAAAMAHADAGFGAAMAHADARFGVLLARFTGLERQVDALADDMGLVKAHLLGVIRAG